jgi:hypothetical protein
MTPDCLGVAPEHAPLAQERSSRGLDYSMERRHEMEYHRCRPHLRYCAPGSGIAPRPLRAPNLVMHYSIIHRGYADERRLSRHTEASLRMSEVK